MNPFGMDTVYFNAMCFLLPVYECKPLNGNLLTTQQMQFCIESMLLTNQVQGPYLCRDFCDPSPFNTDNQLYQDPIFGCVCLIGVGVGSGNGAPPYVPDFSVIGHRRALQHLPAVGPDGMSSYLNATFAERTVMRAKRYMSGAFANPALPSATDGVTACVREEHCAVESAACRRPDGKTTPCEACPLRLSQPNFTGYTCASAKCTCISPPPAPVYESEMLPPVWRGYSRCAVVGRAYGNRTAELSALEYVALRECTTLYRVGQLLGLVSGAPLDPSVAYDLSETLRVGFTVVAGGVLEGVYNGSPRAEVEVAMLEAGVDPVLYFALREPALASFDRIATAFPRAAQLAATTGAAGVKLSLAVSKAPKSDELFSIVGMLADGARTAVEELRPPHGQRHPDTPPTGNATAGGMGGHESPHSEAPHPNESPHLVWVARRLRAAVPPEAAATLEHVSEVGRVGARELRALTDTSCWVLAEARDVANDVLANIKNQYSYNTARAVCIFLERSNCPERYEDYYAASFVTPPPPPHPPPYRAPPPKPPSAAPVVVPAYPHLKTLHGQILAGVGALAGVDLSDLLNTWMQDALHWSPANPAVVQQSLTEVTKVLACDYNNSVFCLKRKKTLLEGIMLLAAGVFVVNVALKFLGLDLTLVANIFMTIFFVPVLFKITYDIPFGCTMLPPFIFPVCLLDDLLPHFTQIFARHIAWPPALLVNGARMTSTLPNAFGAAKTVTTITKAQVVDCVAETQLYDGARYILWALEAYVPMWRRKVPLVTTLLSTQSSIYSFLTMYQGVPHATLAGPVYKACAGTMFPVLFPALAILVLLGVFGLGIVHILFVFLKNLLRAASSSSEALTSYFETAKDELAEDSEDDDDNEAEKTT
jgi:hypothetical protein